MNVRESVSKANSFCIEIGPNPSTRRCNNLSINPLQTGMCLQAKWRPRPPEVAISNYTNMIDLKRISKWVNVGGKPNFILKDINLDIKEGEFVQIMGSSGSGKTSLLNIIGMLDDSSEGEYFFFGQAVHTLKEKQRSQLYKQYIGFVFQAYHLIDELTVYENIETPLIYQNVKSSERQAMVADILDRFQIVGKKDLFPTQLSGGQQQLVGIARALIGKPKLLLADEPTGNLNSRQGEEIMGLFKELNDEGVTIIQVTHSEKNAGYGSRIVRLLDGMIDNFN